MDIRDGTERAQRGWIAGATHVPIGHPASWPDEGTFSGLKACGDLGRLTIVYCATGRRSATVVSELIELGYRHVAYLRGGFDAWRQADLPVAGLRSWHQADTSRCHATNRRIRT